MNTEQFEIFILILFGAWLAVTTDPTDRESATGGASPLSPINFTESKPQQTGIGLLIRLGEVATTSGSTNLKEEG